MRTMLNLLFEALDCMEEDTGNKNLFFTEEIESVHNKFIDKYVHYDDINNYLDFLELVNAERKQAFKVGFSTALKLLSETSEFNNLNEAVRPHSLEKDLDIQKNTKNGEK